MNISNKIFSGQCVLITCGTTLIGQTCARLIAAEGALVLLSGEDDLQLETTLESIRNEVPGCSIIGIVADLTTEDGIISFFLHARIAFPKVDAVIINPSSAWKKNVLFT
jgi:NAD(P)-dependent dehydrogenase (short-subunit alcohol dehydrogenase family)